ncbi:MAG: hypothetical protein PHO08_09235 [Methylococcales bacterium]|nr:hypothetical protein [Methylococcales bacterium]
MARFITGLYWMVVFFPFLLTDCSTNYPNYPNYFNKAYDLDQTGNYQQAMQWYHKAADEGDAMAMNNIGVLYEMGQGVTQDFCTALEWFSKGVRGGSEIAKENLERLENFYKARNLESYEKACMAEAYFSKAYKFDQVKDYSQAMQWYLKAAELGNSDAMGNIGVYYHNGWGVSADDCKGHEWQLKAANRGNAFFQINVGNDFRYGRCNSIDLARAEKWYKAALENKNASDEERERAREALKSLQEEKVQEAKEEEQAQARREQDRVEEQLAWEREQREQERKAQRKPHYSSPRKPVALPIRQPAIPQIEPDLRPVE